MHGRLGIFSMVTLCAFGTAIGAEATSPSAVIWANPSGSLLWRTVRETPVKVSIDWPQDAAKAVLTASIGGKELVRAVLTDRSVKVKSLAFAFPHAEGEAATKGKLLLNDAELNDSVTPYTEATDAEGNTGKVPVAMFPVVVLGLPTVSQ